MPASFRVGPALTGNGKFVSMELALSYPPGDDQPKGFPGLRPIPTPARTRGPDWADGLRKLYNSVLNEPLPDSFDDLLKKLDKDGNG